MYLLQVLRFFFYLIFFGIVFTFYGMPLHIVRDLWVSYSTLRRRLQAYRRYRYSALASEYYISNEGQLQHSQEVPPGLPQIQVHCARSQVCKLLVIRVSYNTLRRRLQAYRRCRHGSLASLYRVS